MTVLGALSEVGCPLGKIATQGRVQNLLINSIIKLEYCLSSYLILWEETRWKKKSGTFLWPSLYKSGVTGGAGLFFSESRELMPTLISTPIERQPKKSK